MAAPNPTRQSSSSASASSSRSSKGEQNKQMRVWLPPDEFNAARPFYRDNYVWSPLPFHPSLPVEQTSFIRSAEDGPTPSTPGADPFVAAFPTTGLSQGPETAVAATPSAVPRRAPRPPRSVSVVSAREISPAASSGSGLTSDSNTGLSRALTTTKKSGKKAVRRRPPPVPIIEDDEDEVEDVIPIRGPLSDTIVAGAKGPKSKFAVKLDMNLDIEVELKASIHGDLTLELFN